MASATRVCRVRIEQATDVTGARGGVSQTWSPYGLGTYWAAIIPLSGSEQFRSQQVFASATHQIETRYYPGVTTKMRVVFGTRTFDILNVRNVDERNREMELTCLERLN